MTKLQIHIVSNLLVYKFIAKLFDNDIRYSIARLGFKDNFYVITNSLLMHIKEVCKLVTRSHKSFPRV